MSKRSPDSQAEERIPPDAQVRAALQKTLEGLRLASQPAQAKEILARLREAIAGAQEQEAAEAIREFLGGGQDASTGQSFDVGSEGVLDAAPTLRVWLLDILPSLDPLASVIEARNILSSTQSPDEYAMALRNMAWNDLEGDMTTELAGGFSGMLQREAWRSNPTAGYLEAFDIAAFVGDVGMLQTLASVVATGEQHAPSKSLGVERAAFMALDRIVLRNPGILVEAFEKDAGFLSHAPQHRAALMSRLDPGEAAQRELLIRYLEMPEHGEGELEYFSKLFPNGNSFHGPRLATTEEPTPSIGERERMDREMLLKMREIAPGLR